MDKKLNRLIESGLRFSLVLLLLFVGVSFFYNPYVAAGELALVVTFYIFYRHKQKKRRTDIRKYVENIAYQVDDVSKSSLVNFPLPTSILRLDSGEIVWGNDQFFEAAGMTETMMQMHITDALSGFDTRWLMEGRTLCPYDVEMGGRKYSVYGNVVRASSDTRRSLMGTLFFVDITDFSVLRERYEKSRPVVAIIVLDSYEELYKGMSDAERSVLTANIDKKLNEWTSESQGVLRRLDRDKYLFVFEQQELVRMTGEKFSILEQMHEVKNSEGIMATLSIGISKGDSTLAELHQNALLGIDMALSRGGDQVVIKTKSAFEFYGGRSKEVEKRTKVKSRVMANALRQLIRDSSHVFVMGHKFSDLDSIGAGAGVAAAVRKCGKNPYMVFDGEKTSSPDLIKKLRETPQYEGCFIQEEEAILMADPASLVIVVDTSRPEMVEAPELLQMVQRVAVIDHHRRAASYIENSAISMHETYASSASELVAELLQYIVGPQDILKVEADAMLAGIFLDTKGFTVKTGVRTFEAAAYLKQLGADTIEVRKMFSGGLDTYVKKYQLISSSVRVFPGISLSVTDEEVPRAVAAQAADELINAADILASFVVFADGEGSLVSARSYGKINVQVICEKIGGGGGLNMAGAQFADQGPEQVAQLLKDAIAAYLEDNKNEKGET